MQQRLQSPLSDNSERVLPDFRADMHALSARNRELMQNCYIVRVEYSTAGVDSKELADETVFKKNGNSAEANAPG